MFQRLFLLLVKDACTAQCQPNILPVPPNAKPMSVQFLPNVQPISILCPPSVHPMCRQFMANNQSIFTQCPLKGFNTNSITIEPLCLIFGRLDHYSDSHITGVLPLLPPCSILQNPWSWWSCLSWRPWMLFLGKSRISFDMFMNKSENLITMFGRPAYVLHTRHEWTYCFQLRVGLRKV